MKKIIKRYIKPILAFTILVFLSLPGVLSAQGGMQEMTEAAGTAAGYATDSGQYSLARIIGIIARTFISLIGIIFVSYTIYGGYLWLTSAGNEEKITQAKNIIKNGIIGLIVILMSAAIYIFIRDALIGGGGGGIPGAN